MIYTDEQVEEHSVVCDWDGGMPDDEGGHEDDVDSEGGPVAIRVECPWWVAQQ